ncbi:Formin Homology 2 Domain [Pelomyxa schiedti]|nr:Formin Homology 2 Domain [Pelomyxa schiedti]
MAFPSCHRYYGAVLNLPLHFWGDLASTLSKPRDAVLSALSVLGVIKSIMQHPVGSEDTGCVCDLLSNYLPWFGLVSFPEGTDFENLHSVLLSLLITVCVTVPNFPEKLISTLATSGKYLGPLTALFRNTRSSRTQTKILALLSHILDSVGLQTSKLLLNEFDIDLRVAFSMGRNSVDHGFLIEQVNKIIRVREECFPHKPDSSKLSVPMTMLPWTKMNPAGTIFADISSLDSSIVLPYDDIQHHFTGKSAPIHFTLKKAPSIIDPKLHQELCIQLRTIKLTPEIIVESVCNLNLATFQENTILETLIRHTGDIPADVTEVPLDTASRLVIDIFSAPQCKSNLEVLLFLKQVKLFSCASSSLDVLHNACQLLREHAPLHKFIALLLILFNFVNKTKSSKPILSFEVASALHEIIAPHFFKMLRHLINSSESLHDLKQISTLAVQLEPIFADFIPPQELATQISSLKSRHSCLLGTLSQEVASTIEEKLRLSLEKCTATYKFFCETVKFFGCNTECDIASFFYPFKHFSEILEEVMKKGTKSVLSIIVSCQESFGRSSGVPPPSTSDVPQPPALFPGGPPPPPPTTGSWRRPRVQIPPAIQSIPQPSRTLKKVQLKTSDPCVSSIFSTLNIDGLEVPWQLIEDVYATEHVLAEQSAVFTSQTPLEVPSKHPSVYAKMDEVQSTTSSTVGDAHLLSKAEMLLISSDHPWEHIVEALKQFDEEFFPNKGFCEALLTFPLQEISVGKPIPKGQADIPTEFLLALSRVERISERLQVMVLRKEYPLFASDVEKVLQKTKRGCEVILESGILKRLLLIILKMGNFLNEHSSQRRGATAFRLPLLADLFATKQQNGKNILHSICNMIESNDCFNDLKLIPEELEKIDVTKLPFSFEQPDLLKGHLQKMKASFLALSETFIQKALEEIDGYMTRNTEVVGPLNKVSRFLAVEHPLIASGSWRYHLLQLSLWLHPIGGGTRLFKDSTIPSPTLQSVAWLPFCGLTMRTNSSRCAWFLDSLSNQLRG